MIEKKSFFSEENRSEANLSTLNCLIMTPCIKNHPAESGLAERFTEIEFQQGNTQIVKKWISNSVTTKSPLPTTESTLLDELKRDDDFEFDEASENSEDLVVGASDFSDLIVSPSDWTVGTIFDQIGKQIDLDPEFQRRDVWTLKSKSRFIESLFLGIPIPQIMLSVKADRKGSYIVLDGKQRLLTIYEFLSGRTLDGKPFRLRQMRILTDLEGQTWDEIREDNELEDQLLNETVRTTIVKNWKSQEVLYEIFYRLNSGSVRLSPMELRMALFPGPFLKFIVGWSETISPLHDLLRLRRPDKRMTDVELAVRHLAFVDESVPYNGDLKGFLDAYCKEANQSFDERSSEIENKLDSMNASIALGMKIFPENTFCRKYTDTGYETRFNRAIFDVLVGSLSNSEFFKHAESNKELIAKHYQKLCLTDSEFIRSIESSTKNVEPTKIRFSHWYKTIEEFSGIKIDLPNIRQ